MKKNAIVGQSGGPTAVINASLYGVIEESIEQESIAALYGMINGIEGFMSDSYINLTRDLREEEAELLKLTPAAYLGSCRYKLPDDLASPFYPALFEKFQRLDIGYFFYIGGNDSMDTVSKLSRYASHQKSPVRFIGVPKTIDNDLIETDHTPGFGSAAKYVAATVREIVLDSSVYRQKSVTIVELMGRHAGWLTAASALARKHEGDNPLLIYLPESAFSFERFSEDLEGAFKKNDTVVICISEGIADEKGQFICEYADAARLDTFGHKMLTGAGKMLENFIRDHYHCKVRSIELNVNQRCSGMIASATDIRESIQAGMEAVRTAVRGETGKMITFRRLADAPYTIECGAVDVNQVCNQEKKFPEKWIIDGGTDVSASFITYATPLIQGEVDRKMESGRPVYLYRRDR